MKLTFFISLATAWLALCCQVYAVPVVNSSPGYEGGVACEVLCSYKYEPVCGSDGYTYNSACFLQIENDCSKGKARIHVAHTGACVEPTHDPKNPVAIP